MSLAADELKDYLVGAMTLIGMVSDKLEGTKKKVVVHFILMLLLSLLFISQVLSLAADEEEADDVTVHAILIVQSNGEWNNRTVCDANICGVVQPAKIKRGWVFFSCNAEFIYRFFRYHTTATSRINDKTADTALDCASGTKNICL